MGKSDSWEIYRLHKRFRSWLSLDGAGLSVLGFASMAQEAGGLRLLMAVMAL